MGLHQIIQRLLLLGTHWEPLQPARLSNPPQRLEPVITAIETEHRRFDQRAVRFGNRYHSGFWAIYLLSALAVLCAVLPLALGWDARAWAVGEVIIIGTVSAIYWWGHRRDWQGAWLRARTTAELTWYLPLLTPLLDFSKPADEANWYVRAFDPGQQLRTVDDFAALCARIEPLAREQVANAWADTAFVASYAQWALDILELQRRQHHEIAATQHALLHRVRSINASLFGLTALAAILYLVIHALWLTLVTALFPALGASLHGALAQSEAYRLGTTSERLTRELEGASRNIQTAVTGRTTGDDAIALKAAIEAALALILEEHPDWGLFVRPHRLPRA
jgi:hypothetical protein